MRVYDTEIEFKLPGGRVEINEYHDEGPDYRHPPWWHARIVLVEGERVAIINVNRRTQKELYEALEQLEDVFEAAKTSALDAATVN